MFRSWMTCGITLSLCSACTVGGSGSNDTIEVEASALTVDELGVARWWVADSPLGRDVRGIDDSDQLRVHFADQSGQVQFQLAPYGRIGVLPDGSIASSLSELEGRALDLAAFDIDGGGEVAFASSCQEAINSCAFAIDIVNTYLPVFNFYLDLVRNQLVNRQLSTSIYAFVSVRGLAHTLRTALSGSQYNSPLATLAPARLVAPVEQCAYVDVFSYGQLCP